MNKANYILNLRTG